MTSKPTRAETTEFTTSIRAHLLRERLESVSQFDLDRVLILHFEPREGRGGPLQLILELMPPGNIVLVGGDGKIILSLREVKTQTRRIVRGQPYSPPAQTRASIDTLSTEDIAKALSREKTLGSALGRALSIPRRYVDEVLARIHRRQDDPTNLSQQEVEGLLATINELVASVKEHPWPCLAKGDGTLVEVMVVKPHDREVVETASSLSPLLDKLFFSELVSQETQPGQSSHGRALSSPASRDPRAEAQERRLLEYAATITGLESKREGLVTLSAGLRGVAPLVREASDPSRALEVAKEMGEIPRDLLASLEKQADKGTASIASAIFDRAKSVEQDITDIDGAIASLRLKVKRETAKERAASAKSTPTTVSLSNAKREWYEKFRWFFTTAGKLAIGGRDAQSNSTLIRRHLQDGDTVFHADLFGSPFFILKGGREQKEEEIREVAKGTVTFSSAWKTGLGAADAYWVNPEQISAAGPSGEYLAHGSFAVKGKKNFVTKNPVEIAIGADETGRIVSGPEESIMKVAKAHVTLIPSREKASDTAKRVLHELEPYMAGLPGLSLDEVLRMLPGGAGGKIIRRRVDNKSV
jgi:predicted ribosome quality control (RQC) complex YloA/Tae2 family protein